MLGRRWYLVWRTIVSGLSKQDEIFSIYRWMIQKPGVVLKHLKTFVVQCSDRPDFVAQLAEHCMDY